METLTRQETYSGETRTISPDLVRWFRVSSQATRRFSLEWKQRPSAEHRPLHDVAAFMDSVLEDRFAPDLNERIEREGWHTD